MWRWLWLLCCVAALSGRTAAQEAPLGTTVCKILENPAAFDGKLIRVRAPVVAAWNEFEIIGRECDLERHAIWLRIPPEKLAPAALQAKGQPPTAVATSASPETLVRDENLRRFRRYLMSRVPPKGKSGTCISCYRYDVTATLVGRLQTVESTGPIRDENGKVTGHRGFGHDGSYRAQLVIHSVAEIVAKDRISKYK